jgi:hypothetical protein
MSAPVRIFLLVSGVILVLPAGCAAVFTPVMFLSAFGPDPLGGTLGETFADLLYFVPLGWASVLGGVQLLRCANRGSLSVPAPRWLLAAAGILLLMPGVSFLLSLGIMPRILAPTNPQRMENLTVVLFTPVWVAGGAYLLWRLRQRMSETISDTPPNSNP